MPEEFSRRRLIATLLATTGVVAYASEPDNWKPAFLTSAENDTLVAVGERIIPGSSAAQTNRIIDLVLNIESPKTQAGFRGALKTFMDAGFAKLPAEQQDAFLTRSPQHSFQYLKEWLADAYWTSKPGFKELGFDGQMAWSEFNSCPH